MGGALLKFLSARKCTDADESFLRTLHRRCYHDIVVAQFGGWDDELQRGFFDKKWNPSNYQIIVVDGRDVGAVSYSNLNDRIFLSELQIDPDFQNRGLGSKLVNDVVENAKSQDRSVRLQVLRQNRAITLYSRLGFAEIGQTETHIMMEK